MALRQWNVESEIKLLSLICDFKPAGALKQQNLTLILDSINEGTDQKFTPDQLEAKLDTLFDMTSVDKIEQDDKQDSQEESEEEEKEENEEEVEEVEEEEEEEEEKEEDKVKVEDLDDAEEKLSRAKTRTSVAEKRPRRGARVTTTRSLILKATKEAHGSNVTPELSDDYSSELSDVEGEEAVFAKLKDKESTGDANSRKSSFKSNSRKKDLKDLKRTKDFKDSTKATKDNKKQKTGSSIEESKNGKEVDVDSSEKEEESTQTTEQTPEVKTPVESAEPPVLRKRTRANAKLDNVDELPAKKLARISIKKGVKKEATPEEVELSKAESPEAEDEPKKRRSSRQTARRNSRRN